MTEENGRMHEDIELSERMLSPVESNGNPVETIRPQPYPKGVAFIALTELGSRFSYYGSRAVLTLYLRNVLEFSEDATTTLYHTFLLLCYCLPMLWGIAADSGLGMYNTIWVVNLLFLIGNGLLTVSALPVLPVVLTMSGLILMAVATGGMKPCLAPFGGDQFSLPQQSIRLQQFFSIFFIATTIGNMAATVVTPILRKDVSCLGQETCYPLAFGVASFAMLFAVVMFVAGRPFYKRRKVEGNTLIKVFRCVKHALVTRSKSAEKRSHWLDYAEDTFPSKLIMDIKQLLGLLIYYAPMPMFFALLEQLGSRWTMQATRMNGKIGNFHIKPDQMQVSNSIFMLLLTPVFEGILYPLCSRCSLLRRPLQRMGIGLFLAGAAFLAAGVVETYIEGNLDSTLHSDHIRLVNTLPCRLSITVSGRDANTDTPIILLPYEHVTMLDLSNSSFFTIGVQEDSTECSVLDWTGSYSEKGTGSFLVLSENGAIQLHSIPLSKKDLTQSKEGNAKLLVLLHGEEMKTPFISMHRNANTPSVSISIPDQSSSQQSNASTWKLSRMTELSPELYYFTPFDASKGNKSNQLQEPTLSLQTGGVYLLLILSGDGHTETLTEKVSMITLTSPNEVHILLLLPQYILMSSAQILFIVSGMEFSFTQAPPSMKSVLQALWNLMNAFGNLIVILSVSTHSSYPQSQATEYFQFAALMAVDVLFFAFLAMRYKYVDDVVKN